MIFVTVGVQLPFDRLVRAVDAWAGERMRSDVFAQIGPSQYRPQHIEFRAFVEPPEFRRLVECADAVVAHAGMGSIITALELAKPLIVMPRRAELGEHRNDHQLSTARHMLAHPRLCERGAYRSDLIVPRRLQQALTRVLATTVVN
jgi:UDP-N-acetylglucosamine transferase subunit ALG13